MDLEKYKQDVFTSTPCFQLMCHAIADHEMRAITQNEHDLVMKEVMRMFQIEVLERLYLKATPEALKAAKKTVKSYIEQLIHKEQKSGPLSSENAKKLKAQLPEFLHNKTTDK